MVENRVHNVLWQTIKPEYLVQQCLECFKSGGELGQGNQATGLGKAINDSEYGGIIVRIGKISDGVYGDM